MPPAPKRPCSTPHCPEYQPCPNPKHNVQRKQDKARGTARERGYTTRWDVYSRWFRQQADCRCGRNHALCERCQAVGKYEFSQMTDHIVPVHGPKDPLFWIHSNHQGLSNMCHQIKTREDIEKGLTR